MLHGRFLAGAWLICMIAGCSSTCPLSQNASSVPAPEALRAKAELPPSQAATACFLTAKELEAKGFDEDAAQQYERARQLDPRLAKQVSPRLAVLHDRLGHDDRAAAEFEQALQDGHASASLLNDAGYFHYQRGRLDEAEKYFRQAQRKNPKYNRAWVNLGTVLVQQGKTAEGLEAFTKAVRPADAYSNVGVLLAKQGHREDAIQNLQHALQLDPSLRQARAFLTALEKHQDVSAAP